MNKISEDAQYEIFELRNDSLKIGSPFEMTIDVRLNESPFQILEQKIVQKIASSPQNASSLTPIIEIVGSGWVKKHEVTRIIIHQNRRQGTIDYISQYLKFKIKKRVKNVFKKQSIAVEDHPFANGKWAKISFQKLGIYEITPSLLTEAGFDINTIDPRNIQIWALSGDMIPEKNNLITDSFSEIPIRISGESDGVLNSTDRIYFYGQSAYRSIRKPNVSNEPVFSHSLHYYSNENAVFITVGSSAGKRMEVSNSGLNGSTQVSTVKAHVWKEDELHKTEDDLRSGRLWLGQLFSTESFTRKQTILEDTLVGFVPNSSLKLQLRYFARASGNSKFTTFLNNQSQSVLEISRLPNLNGVEGQSANYRDLSLTISSLALSNSIIKLESDFENATQGATGWLDYLDIEYVRNLIAERNFLEFFPPFGLNENVPVQFVLSGFSSEPMILDVTNSKLPSLLNSSASGSTYLVQSLPNPYKRIIAQSSFFKPIKVEVIENQNISGLTFQPNYIVVTIDKLMDQANRLANYRAEKDGFRTLVVTQNQLFNEFSGGNPDIMAIRLLMKHFYDRATTDDELPRYLMLFGDTHFDYKQIESEVGLEDFVFTYQSTESISRTGSYGSDDFFGLLDANEGDWVDSNQLLDLAVGRLPAQTDAEAKIVVDKIIHYESSGTAFGDWRTLFTFAADDDRPDARFNRDLHVLNADGTSTVIDEESSGIRLKKIYLFDYPAENTAGGRRFPQATRDFLNTINQGTLVVNYSGHGAEQVLSDERFFVTTMIPELTNINKLSVFVTATCSFGRFDDYLSQSGGEKLVLYEKGGAIASLTTTRVVYTYSDPNTLNYGLNRVLTTLMSTREPESNLPRRLGDIYQITKITGSVGPSSNSRRFVLIGDPATRLNLPKQEMKVTSINSVSIPDNGIIGLNALDEVEITGEVIGSNLNIDQTFSGEVLVQIRDSRRFINLPATEEWGVKSNGDFDCNMPNCGYFSQNDILFNGRASVTNGRFSAKFILPKDLGFDGGAGKILLYANNGSLDATGAFSRIAVTGLNTNATNDGVGPEVEVFMNDESFVPGALVNSRPSLIVKLSDPSGINSAASGVGHEMTAKLKNSAGNEQIIVLNEFFVTELNNYKSGEVNYTFDDLSEGEYELSIRAWDIFNNPSEQKTFFTVSSSDELVIRNVYNYPNPFSKKTKFVIEHNQPNNPLSVLVRVFTLTGRPVLYINEPQILTSSPFIQIDWDGRDRDGDRLATGTYLYHVKVKSETISGTKTKEIIQKLVIIN